MKSAILTIFKKELTRFFSDKRVAITTILLPGLMIFLMYNFMGSAISDFIGADSESFYIRSLNMPTAMQETLEAAGFNVQTTDADGLEKIKELIRNDARYDACVVFPQNFEQAVADYDVRSGKAAPSVEIYYNSSSTASTMAFSALSAALDAYEDSLCNKFDVNAGSGTYDLAEAENITGKFFSMMLPMLLMIFLYSGCMAVGVEAIAGEKERGTIATLLVSPVKRSHIAIGKILALSLIALMSGASSATGTLLSLPKLVGGAGDGMIDGSVYTAADYALLALVILSTVLVLITIISSISAFAKSVKEAQTYVLPIMIVVMGVGISGMFGSAPTNPAMYLIPLYNSVQSMVCIFSMKISYLNILITVATNLAFAGGGVFLLSKLFSNEKVMFSK